MWFLERLQILQSHIKDSAFLSCPQLFHSLARKSWATYLSKSHLPLLYNGVCENYRWWTLLVLCYFCCSINESFLLFMIMLGRCCWVKNAGTPWTLFTWRWTCAHAQSSKLNTEHPFCEKETAGCWKSTKRKYSGIWIKSLDKQVKI